MAIDTADKRRNVSRMLTFPLLMSLTPSTGLSDDDRENATSVYIGFSYESAMVAAQKSRARIGVCCGIGM